MQKSGKKTLLWSVLMSSAGPIVVGAGLIVGQSSTQLADFIRRSAELLPSFHSNLFFRVVSTVQASLLIISRHL